MKTITYPNEDPYASLEERVRKLERRLSVAHGQLNDLTTLPIAINEFSDPTVVPGPETVNEAVLEVPEWSNSVAVIAIARLRVVNGDGSLRSFSQSITIRVQTGPVSNSTTFESEPLVVDAGLTRSSVINKSFVSNAMPGGEVVVEQSASAQSGSHTGYAYLSGLVIFRRTS